jgi:hypothetical protein
MPETRKPRWAALAALVAGALAGIAAWWYAARSTGPAAPPGNAIMVVAPYWYNGTWVFDDPEVGLRREPFVAGVPEMIDVLVEGIPDAKDGFRLLFSANPFPGHQKTLTWLRGDSQGNFYKLDDPPMESWICPAMFKYYRAPPKTIYVKAEAKRR